MATFHHPKTGVELNIITIQRAHLDAVEEETARQLVQEGNDQHIVAAMLGTNPGRVNDAVKGHSCDGRQRPLI